MSVEPVNDPTPSGLTVDWQGETWQLSGLSPSPMIMLELAHLSEAGADTEQQEAYALIFELLEELVHPDDWTRFRRFARRHRISGDDLMHGFAKAATEAVIDHPSKRSSVSPDGPPATDSSSRVDSSSPAAERVKDPVEVIEDLNLRGRPDLAQIVRQRAELQPA